ncbi:N-acetyltransferase [uncultured Treponema sp.]|uniref:GNAT family N-acetyltransferase n=1 Tax=uncultured Treponema sp. TaxID=162155 RepID=UPI0025F1BD18|nr:N-acetyltransferase [uncultured Treponema sp.]
MIICPAQHFDIFSIMNIERQSFIPAIQEKKRVFEKRLKIFPEGFLLLADCSDEVVLKNKTALVCGYLCSERWDFLPACDEKLLRKRFALGHNPLHTHKTEGPFLYISSFALLKDYRSKGLGSKFFKNAVAALCSSLHGIEKVVIIVNSEWEAALKIYRSIGFEEYFILKEFFPTIQKKVCSDGIIMTLDAAKFREMEFSGGEEAIKI